MRAKKKTARLITGRFIASWFRRNDHVARGEPVVVVVVVSSN